MKPLLALVTCLLFAGCFARQVADGHDPFVVEAEADLRTAFHVVDGFLAWEQANRAGLSPEVTALANQLRRDFPGYLDSAERVLATYKRARDPASKVQVNTWLVTVNSAMLAALEHLPPSETSTAQKAARKWTP